jgi:hypothetical protein
VILLPDVTFNETWDAVLITQERHQGQASVFNLTFLEVTLQASHTLSEMALVQAFHRFRAAGVHASAKVKHIGLVEAKAFSRFKFNRTSTLPTIKTRSGDCPVPEEFSIECLVATITAPQV